MSAETAATQLHARKITESNRETMSSVEGLREVIEGRPALSAELRTAVLALTRTATK